MTNLAELEAYVKAHPRELSYASPGTGSPQHLGMEIIRNAYGMDLVHIPYKGVGRQLLMWWAAKSNWACWVWRQR